MKKEIATLAENLKQSGFDVYAPEKGTTYIWVVSGSDIAYIQHDDYEGYSISTVHKANQQSGTGFGVYRDGRMPSVGDVERGFSVAPHEFSGYAKSVKKYASFEEYKKVNNWQNYIKL